LDVWIVMIPQFIEEEKTPSGYLAIHAAAPLLPG
jgi:hypothetical protein